MTHVDIRHFTCSFFQMPLIPQPRLRLRLRLRLLHLPQTLQMSLPQQPPPKRPTCPSCTKPLRLCLCTRFKTPSFNNPISITILQHNHERTHPLNSARIVKLGLKNVTLATVSDVHLQAKFTINLNKTHKKSSLEDKNHEPDISATIAKLGFTCSLTKLRTLNKTVEKLDFEKLLGEQVGKDAVLNGFVVKKVNQESGGSEEFEILVPPGTALLFPTKKARNLEEVGRQGFEVKNLIVLDGTWAKAKRMYHENPWLKLLPHVKLDVKTLSLYSEVRKQPEVGCLSTIESIVCAMKGLGEDCVKLDDLLDVFESMVVDQRRCKDERISGLSVP